MFLRNRKLFLWFSSKKSLLKMTKFEAFLNLYVAYLASKHEGNEYWQTDAQIIENCGGKDEIKNIYYIWDCVSPEKQKEVCGFTSADLLQYLSEHEL